MVLSFSKAGWDCLGVEKRKIENRGGKNRKGKIFFSFSLISYLFYIYLFIGERQCVPAEILLQFLNRVSLCYFKEVYRRNRYPMPCSFWHNFSSSRQFSGWVCHPFFARSGRYFLSLLYFLAFIDIFFSFHC